MATKGIKIKDNSNNVLLPVTSSDLVEVNYGGQTKILTALLEENEQVTAEALIDLNNRIDTALENISTAHLQYGICGTAASTAAKTVTINDFSLVDGAMFTVKFSNTNNANTAPTLNLNSTGAKAMYRLFEANLLRVVGGYLRADYYYTFLYDLNNDRYIVIDSTFNTNDVIEIICTDNGSQYVFDPDIATLINIYDPVTGEINPSVQDFAAPQSALVFSQVPLYSDIKKYRVILTYPTSTMGENYIKLVLNITSGTLDANVHYTDTAVGMGTNSPVYWSTFKSFVCEYPIQFDITKGYINYIDTTNNDYRKYTNFTFQDTSSTHPRVSDAVSGMPGPRNTDYILDQYIVSDVSSRKQNIGELNVDGGSCIYLAGKYNSTINTVAPYVHIRSRSGIVDSCMPNCSSRSNPAASMNITDANVVIDWYDSNYNPCDNLPSYAFMRYETPLIYYTNVAAKCSIATKCHRYYSTTYNGYIGTPCKTYGPGAVAYAYCTIGNNYYDITNYPNGEMFFYNGSNLRNYLTAYVVPGDLDTKLLKNGTELRFGSGNADGNLIINETTITFDGASQGWTYPTEIGIQNIRTSELTIKDVMSGAQTATLGGTGATFYTNVTAPHFYESSDERIKTDIKPLTNSEMLNIYSFKKNGSERTSYGFIAQEVQKSYPDLVATTYETSYLTVDYNSTLSVLLASALNKIDKLEKRVEELEQKLENK